MKIEISYNKDHHCLTSKFIGDLTLESVQKYAEEVAKSAKIYDCKRFVNDLREANVHLSISDFFNAPQKVSIGSFDRTWKRAVVVKQKTENLKFFETTSANQGFHVRVFENMDDALEWL